jgi:hypothetical protein
MTTTPLPSIPELAARVANDIRTIGHFQSKKGQTLWGDPPQDGDTQPLCCVLFNPTVNSFRDTVAGNELYTEFSTAVEIQAQSFPKGAITWNDHTETDEVLDVLDALAACG